MTTTFTTDEQVKLRSPLVSAAVSAINAALVAAGDTATSLDAYRVEAQRQILEAFAAQGIVAAQVTNAEGVREAEVTLALALVFEAAMQRPNPRNPGAVDLYAQNAERWRVAAEAALAKARPVAYQRPHGGSFEWGRG